MYDSPASPTGAYAGKTASKKRVYVAGTETSIENAALSDDGEYVVLNFHISSGGWGAAYQRKKDGTYRKILDHNHAWELVRAGRVRGLTDADLESRNGRNPFGGLGILPDTKELIFSHNWRHLIFYSLRERRITSRQTALLQYVGWRQHGEGAFSLRLDELSRNRGVALCVWESRRDVCDVFEQLMVFPQAKSLLPAMQTQSEFRLKAEEIELVARKTEEVINERGAVWDVEITGTGAKYEALQERLAKIRSSVQLHEREPLQWKTPTSFTALPE